jgi:saccharopine dehydrogenase-like NADP-dependent oxidoreductase
MEVNMQITVLGAGLVGSAIVKDLAREPGWTVLAVDRDPETLEVLQAQAPIETLHANLLEEGVIARSVRDASLVICAVPGFMGFQTLKQVIEAGKDVVDISFFGQNAFLLDGLAQERGITAVVDCGVAPGLCNILAGHVDSTLDQLNSYTCYVGGLPQERRWPYEYGVVFSPVDVIEEYTRPARFVEHGRQVVRPALSDVELRDYSGVGTLEAFNTDGLRTLMRTLNAPYMKEKTLRYPGHAELMRVFRESGFFEAAPIEVGGQQITPLALTSRLLFEQWALGPDEEDLTVMQVVIEGRTHRTGRAASLARTYTYDLLDRYDRETRTTSMARTTGYTCAIVARQVAHGLFSQTGICPPEFVGRTPGCYEDLLAEYAKRGIHLTETITERALDGQ